MNIVKTTKELADLFCEKNLGSLFVKAGEIEINMTAKCPEYTHVSTPVTAIPTMAVAAETAPAVPEVVKSGNYITSPIVGTFYTSPAPDKPPFVKLGDKVTKGQVVCIVESMKLMNEINSDFDGTVAAILAMDGDAVDFGKELIQIV